MSDNPPLVAGDGSCVLAGSPEEADWLGQEQRRLARYPVQASRPIALRLLDPEKRPQGLWHLADILDISRGGLCLMLSDLQDLPTGLVLQLDVRSHPDFGLLRLESEVRWCRSAHGFTTVGVAFLMPLDHIPRLEIERRTSRPDPNNEPWAKED
ncbi:MAG: PilZ domain-containing protein [Cyanobium sp.]